MKGEDSAAANKADAHSKGKDKIEDDKKEDEKKEEEPPIIPFPRKVHCCCGITYNTASLVIGLVDLVFTIVLVILVIHLSNVTSVK